MYEQMILIKCFNMMVSYIKSVMYIKVVAFKKLYFLQNLIIKFINLVLNKIQYKTLMLSCVWHM